MKATKLLEKQHREVEAMFESIKKGKGDLAQLVGNLADALVAHMTIEQQIFYPSVKEVDEDLIFESFEEHAAAEVELRRLLACDVADPAFKARVTVLEEMIKHHVGEEEKELFPKVEKAIDAKKLEAMGAEMETLFGEVKEEGHEATLSKVAPKTSVDESFQDIRASAPSMI